MPNPYISAVIGATFGIVMATLIRWLIDRRPRPADSTYAFKELESERHYEDLQRDGFNNLCTRMMHNGEAFSGNAGLDPRKVIGHDAELRSSDRDISNMVEAFSHHFETTVGFKDESYITAQFGDERKTIAVKTIRKVGNWSVPTEADRLPNWAKMKVGELLEVNGEHLVWVGITGPVERVGFRK